MNGKNIYSGYKGFTLLELIIALAILCLVLGIAYPVMELNNKATSTQLKESAQRTEVRTAAGYLTNDIRYSKDASSGGQSSLTVVDKDNVTIRYYIDTDAKGNTFLARDKNGVVSALKEIRNAGFAIKNSKKLVEVSLVTDIENSKHVDFKVNRLLPDLTADWQAIRPVKETFEQFVKNKNIFVFGNNMEMHGGSLVAGLDTTVCFRQGLTLDNGGHIATKKAYINGNVELSGGATVGNNDSETYVDGNVNVSNGANIYGKLFYTKGLTGSINAVWQKVDAIQFPDFNIPPLKADTWYKTNGYSSIATDRDNMRFFGSSYTGGGGVSFNNAIIVSKGNISLGNGVHISGILFAPNGTVTIEGGSGFTGIIVAKKVVISNGGNVIFQSVDSFENLPF